MPNNIHDKIAWAARNEITEHHIYLRVAAREKNPHNREILEKIAAQEKGHYDHWVKILGHDIAPSRLKIWLYSTFTAIFGLSFSLKLMEKGEGLAVKMYQDIGTEQPEALDIMKDEQQHEEYLLGLINEGALRYISSIVLGLNDALVELTGALAGLTLALQETKLIAVVGLITGIAASFAMAASEYLSTKEESGRNPIQAGLITGAAYFVTVMLLITPFLVLSNAFAALAGTLSMAILIILIFTFYTAVAKSLSFKKKFAEMAIISLSIAALNFAIGYAIKQFFGI